MPSPGSLSIALRVLSLLLSACPLLVKGQIFTITDGTVASCTGAILDSGGQGGQGYGDNESYTTTICPDGPGQNINITWVTFNLSTAGSGQIDNLAVYDGPTTADPLMGVFTGNQIQGQVVSASPGNPSGCLTLVFTSNDNGTGIFAGTISCVTPCFPPVAVADVGEPLPAMVCPDEVITYDGSGSYPSAGFSIVQYEWEFGDGSSASGPIVTHSFSDPAAYTAQLTVTDDNGCTNTQTVDVLVFVGTTPLFTGTTESLSVCEGGLVDLYGFVTPVTWGEIPEVDFGAGVYLPDNVGQTFSSQLTYGFFPPGSTLTDVNDLLGVCVEMEHSFMGDLVISVTCPNGQSVVLHQQGGGGTYIGGANDTDNAQNPVPGTCWNYCWSPNATLGTFANCAAFGPTPNVMPGGNPQNNALIPGTYSSVNPMSALVGCPLNGTWTFSVSDLWAIDNGFLCTWNINFDPSLYPDLVEFTPTIVDVAWSGQGVAPTPGDPFGATVTTTDPGVYDYNFTVTDDFGCTYDTTIAVTVTNAPEVGATVTLGSTCSEPASLHAEITAFAPPPPNCDYSLVMHDSFGDGWNGGANLQVVINGVSTTYTMPTGGNNLTVTIPMPVGATISLIWTAGTTWNNENSFEFLNNTGVVLYDSPNGPPSSVVWTGIGDCGSNIGPVTWQWTPAAGVDTPNSPDALAQVTQPTTMVVQVFPFGQPWCFGTDTVEVLPPSFLENDSIVTDVLCNGGLGSIQLITTGLVSPWNYEWRDGSGAVVQTTNGSDGDVLNAIAGTYTAYISEGPLGNGCLDTLTATISEPPPLVWVSTPDDTLICLTGNALLAAEAQGGTGAIVLQWSQGLGGNGPHSVSPSDTTTYSVQAIDANGCFTQAALVTVFVRPPITFTPLQTDTECYGIPVPFMVMDASGGDGAYQYDWGNGAQASNSIDVLQPYSANVCVTVNDGCETPPVTSCAWLEILHTPPIEILADTTFGCAPFSVIMLLTDTTAGALVDWTYGDGVVEQAMDSVVHTYTNAGNYTIGTVITWPNGCVTDTIIHDFVRVLTVPIATVTWTPSPASINDPVVHFIDQSVPNVVSWQWDFGELGTSDEQYPVIEFPNEVGGTYPVMLVVANELGCSDTLRTWVDVNDEFMVWVPNAFTPNQEGTNETFFVSGNDLSPEGFELIIFDRWGGEVFHSNDLFEHWDGSSRGQALPQGVYPYRLEIHALSSRKKRIIYGHVNLLH